MKFLPAYNTLLRDKMKELNIAGEALTYLVDNEDRIVSEIKFARYRYFVDDVFDIILDKVWGHMLYKGIKKRELELFFDKVYDILVKCRS